jgi:hypothetical protein
MESSYSEMGSPTAAMTSFLFEETEAPRLSKVSGERNDVKAWAKVGLSLGRVHLNGLCENPEPFIKRPLESRRARGRHVEKQNGANCNRLLR